MKKWANKLNRNISKEEIQMAKILKTHKYFSIRGWDRSAMFSEENLQGDGYWVCHEGW
jgi:hypothetical protein